MPGRTTVLVFVVLLVGMSATYVAFPGMAFFQTAGPVALIPLTLAIGIPFDNVRRGRRCAAALGLSGFEPCGAEGADDDVEIAALSMGPDPLQPEERTMIVVGEVRGRTVYLATYSANGVCRYAFAAIQTARAWPEAIVRRRRIFSDSRISHDLQRWAFSRHRELLSSAPAESIQPFRELSGWFVTDDAVRKSFCMHEIPGKDEQWSFRENWVTLADRGHAGPKQLLQLAKFLTAFAEAADALPDATASGFLDSFAGETPPESA